VCCLRSLFSLFNGCYVKRAAPHITGMLCSLCACHGARQGDASAKTGSCCPHSLVDSAAHSCEGGGDAMPAQGRCVLHIHASWQPTHTCWGWCPTPLLCYGLLAGYSGALRGFAVGLVWVWRVPCEACVVEEGQGLAAVVLAACRLDLAACMACWSGCFQGGQGGIGPSVAGPHGEQLRWCEWSESNLCVFATCCVCLWGGTGHLYRPLSKSVVCVRVEAW
jgi:hypothetical protein